MAKILQVKLIEGRITEQLEHIYKKLISNNHEHTPIRILSDKEQFDFAIPLELKAFIEGMKFNQRLNS